MKHLIHWVSLTCLLACSGKTLDVGSDRDGVHSADPMGSGAGGSASAGLLPLPTWPAPDACAVDEDLPLVGVWTGYLEGDQSPTGVLRIEILGASEQAGVCGTVTRSVMRGGLMVPKSPRLERRGDSASPPSVLVAVAREARGQRR